MLPILLHQIQAARKPYRFMLAGQCLDCQGLVADGRQRPMLVTIGAKDVGQHRRVTAVGLLARLIAPFPVAGDRPRIDRVDREASRSQRENQQVLIGLQPDRRLGRAAALIGDQGKQAV
jgi:hypothetical protein